LDLGLGAGSDAGKDAGVGEDGVKGGGELGGQREVIVDGLVEIDESRLKIRRQTNRVSKMLRRQAKGTSRRESARTTSSTSFDFACLFLSSHPGFPSRQLKFEISAKQINSSTGNERCTLSDLASSPASSSLGRGNEQGPETTSW
jgi:hypothetical protein